MGTSGGSRLYTEMQSSSFSCEHANMYIFGAEQDRAAQCMKAISQIRRADRRSCLPKQRAPDRLLLQSLAASGDLCLVYAQ